MFRAAVDMRLECVGKAEVRQMSPDPSSRARGGDGFGKALRQPAHEPERACDCRNPFAQRSIAKRAGGLVEFGRKLASDPALDGIDEVAPGEARIMFDRFGDAGRMAEAGQQLGKMAVALELAFDEHAVEVEDDRVEVDHSSSNSAVPIRTAVAPSIIAASKSLDIPMLKAVTSCRRASFARSAK